MTANLALMALVAGLYATGAFLLLERSLTRVLLGILLLGNGTNVLLIASGPAGRAPIAGSGGERPMSDALVQAMILTAIVITLGLTAFLLALVHRSWSLAPHGDDVLDDEEDRRVAGRDGPDVATVVSR